ncbi:MAG: hypothetical protein DI551_11530 [Micavibrio aeruginosavorus]|uniref:Uncharacterized protein n=1 Tax=Micavibrio aeruginosavorus TaxID=349221 RepID=A0A2W5PMG7_9BACT|nr:MAG: hypothetical protein DI551_11530 [Micavibrio aeruginosavorus]
MSAKVLDRPDVATRSPVKPEVKPPRKWRIVLDHSEIQHYIPAAVCLLQDIFNKVRGEAVEHIQNARANGTEVVFTGPEDAVRDKVEVAESCRIERSAYIDQRLHYIRFSPESF